MRLDSRTIQILKNFSTINPSIMFRPGNTIATVSPTKTIMAKANVNVKFDKQFAIYDLSRFLATLSLFNDPDIEITDKSVIITEGNKVLNYTVAEAALIVSPSERPIKFPDPEISFALTAAELSETMKAISVLSLPEIAVTGNGTDLKLQALNSKDPTSDLYALNVGSTSANFRMYIRTEYLKILSGDYQVDISAKGLSRFTTNDIEYYIAVEDTSSYDV